MNYKKLYNTIITKRQSCPLKDGEYGEKHHIIPKSLHGDNSFENIVKLSAREHFICHFLLTKMYKYETFEWYKMNHAFIMMKSNSSNQNRYFNNRLYECKRKAFSKVMSEMNSGNKNFNYGKIWIYNKEQKISKSICKQDFFDYKLLDWKLGRVINWKNVNNKKTKEQIKEQKLINKKKKEERRKRKEIEKKRIKEVMRIRSQHKEERKERANIRRLEISSHTSQSGVYINKCRRNKINEIFNINLDDNFQEKFDELGTMLNKLYNIDKCSLTDIADLYNTNYQTVSNYLNLFNIERRTFSEAVKNYISKETI